MAAGSAQRRTIKTMCPMDCHPSYCGMEVEVENGRVVRVRGDKENPDSRGFLCVRGANALDVVYHPDRLRVPLRRTADDGWEEITWDAALDLMAERIETVGREAVGLWSGHGVLFNSLGNRLLRRFANYYGCQRWHPAIICWALGGFGLAMTGLLETNTKEDMGQHSKTIVMWGANFASQPNTTPHVTAAKRRGATLVVVDVRLSEAAEAADLAILVRPGSDAALALAMMHVIIQEGLYDADFVEQHTIGFDELQQHVRDKTPEWAEAITGVSAETIRRFARLYATNRPSMIVLSGSSLYKGTNSWLHSRAISCLPALTGQVGIPGGGMGPRHGSFSHGEALNNIFADDKQPPGDYIPSQMTRITDAIVEGRVRVLLTFGTNLISNFANSNRLARGLERLELLTVHDLFMNDTARRYAQLVLPGTSWLEETGFKNTNTHVYLMDQVIEPVGEARSMAWVLRELAQRLGLEGYYPWRSQEEMVDDILDRDSTGHVTAAQLRQRGYKEPLRISHVAYPTHRFHTPSKKVEFWSERCARWGLPPLPDYLPSAESPAGSPELAARYPLMLRPGRTFTHFHSFYDSGRKVKALARLDPEPLVWLHPEDARTRGIAAGDWVAIFNDRGRLRARANVTDRVLAGVVWMRDGWPGMNDLTSDAPVLPDEVAEALPVPAGQAAFDALVQVERAAD